MLNQLCNFKKMFNIVRQNNTQKEWINSKQHIINKQTVRCNEIILKYLYSVKIRGFCETFFITFVD